MDLTPPPCVPGKTVQTRVGIEPNLAQSIIFRASGKSLDIDGQADGNILP